MKKYLIIFIIAGLFIFAGCASMTVMTDFDEQADFNSYRTFGFLPQKERPDARSPLNNRFLRLRVEDAIQNEMEAKGFRFVDKGKADIRIAYHVSMRDKVRVDHYGYHPWRGPRHTEVTRYKQGTLIIDFVDTDEKVMVWRGWASGVINSPQEAEEHVKKAVKRIIDKYPPED